MAWFSAECSKRIPTKVTDCLHEQQACTRKTSVKHITNKVVLCFVRGSEKYLFLFILISQLSVHPLPTISSENRE